MTARGQRRRCPPISLGGTVAVRGRATFRRSAVGPTALTKALFETGRVEAASGPARAPSTALCGLVRSSTMDYSSRLFKLFMSKFLYPSISIGLLT